jgi:hypothetical protein
VSEEESNHDEMVHFSLPRSEITALKNAIAFNAEFAQRLSFALILQLIYKGQYSQVASSVLREINCLEKGVETNTKIAKQFRREPLKPFWHKHFYTSDKLLKNIGIRWNIDGENGNKDLDTMIEQVCSEHGDDPEKIPNSIAQKFVMDALKDRAVQSRLTGDWIVFGKYAGQNYYLRLATHKQGTTDPEGLFQMLKTGSAAEFPFLFKD